MSLMTILFYGAEKEGERGRERWVDLGRFMTPGLRKDLQCHG